MPYSKEEILQWRSMREVWVHYCKIKKTSIEAPSGQFCIWCKLSEHEHRMQQSQKENVRTWFKEG